MPGYLGILTAIIVSYTMGRGAAMSILAVSNQKGGSAKTTTAINLGAAVAALGKRVLLVDADPQGHLAEGFDVASSALDKELSLVLDGSLSLTDIIVNLRPNLDLAPSNIRLSYLEATLFTKHRREDKLKNALTVTESNYDFIIIDCPPSLGLLTVNALSAAEWVLIPMVCDFYAMLGVSLLLGVIEDMRIELNPSLQILGILPTRLNRTIHAREVLERTKAELKDRVRVFDPAVNESVRFKEAAAAGKTIFEYAPDIQGAEAYRNLAKEIVDGI
ncbi:MAG: AAA family ATPase [Dehalococcoidia bacterium]|nr:MAG: AAA family ATPase [Dehalococcoidia bacterium]